MPSRTVRRAVSPAPWWTIAQALQRLAPVYGTAQSPRMYDAVAELVYTILSQNTADFNSIPAYARLCAAFPDSRQREGLADWNAIADAPTARVIAATEQGGLARVKAPRIQQVLRDIKRRTGGYDLSFLARTPLPEAKAWLRELPGVGPKTVGCVLLFALGMPALPVDTHVYRVAQRLGFIGLKVTPDQSHDLLEAMLAPEQVLPFHMYLIQHGRVVCKAQRPRCGDCVLAERCPGRQEAAE